MTSIKVIGGTLEGGDSTLCTTCRWSHISEGLRMKDRIVACHQLPSENSLITFPVKRCNGYKSADSISLDDMYEQAWILRTDSKTRKIGFTPYKDLSDDEKSRMR